MKQRAREAVQTKVEIDGLKWKQTTFFDEYDRCWKIYTTDQVHVGETHGQKVFAVPCPVGH